MTDQKGWSLKGVVYECCRSEGHCPLWFGRDMWHDKPCVSFTTYQIQEGQISNVDMKGITIIYHHDGIGPKFADLKKGIIGEGAAYISDNATGEQRKVLEPFVTKHLSAEGWRKRLGVKFAKIDISEENGTYHIIMPFGEQHTTLTIGGDGKTPIRMGNPPHPISNVKFCNTDFWKYNDYGKNLEFHGTSGVVADFAVQGED